MSKNKGLVLYCRAVYWNKYTFAGFISLFLFGLIAFLCHIFNYPSLVSSAPSNISYPWVKTTLSIIQIMLLGIAWICLWATGAGLETMCKYKNVMHRLQRDGHINRIAADRAYNYMYCSRAGYLKALEDFGHQ